MLSVSLSLCVRPQDLEPPTCRIPTSVFCYHVSLWSPTDVVLVNYLCTPHIFSSHIVFCFGGHLSFLNSLPVLHAPHLGLHVLVAVSIATYYYVMVLCSLPSLFA